VAAWDPLHKLDLQKYSVGIFFINTSSGIYCISWNMAKFLWYIVEILYL
jgi:hypothetical protein